MPLDSRNVAEGIVRGSLGSLGGCLIEGHPEQRRRESRLRRRALVLSILIQTAVLAALILLPLFSKTEHLAHAVSTPVPPYSPYPGSSRDPGVQHVDHQRPKACRFCVRPVIPPTIVTRDPGPSEEAPSDKPQGGGPGLPGTPAGGIPIPDARTPQPPPPAEPRVARPAVLRMTHLDPAMLIYRVDPVYPIVPREMHKEGRVELHARIATDGSIQSLEAVGGDPLFFRSALDAVRQWRYRPTILNGQPVEIDTHITVVYTMAH